MSESPGHPSFFAFLDILKEMHVSKGKDYGSDVDSFANVRASEELGIPAWKGAWLRAKDKIKRIDNFCRKGSLENEPVRDSLLDLASYAIIALILFEEQAPPELPTIGDIHLEGFVDDEIPF